MRASFAHGATAAIALAFLALLRAAGGDDLVAPSLTSRHELSGWLRGLDAITAAAAVVRLLALGGAWYLLAVSMLAAIASGGRRGRVRRAADRATPTPLRRLARHIGGSGLVATIAMPIAMPNAMAVAAPADPTPSPPGTAVLEELPASEEAPPAVGATPVVEPEPGPVIVPSVPEQWTVARGESLWSIAAEHLADSRGRSPSDSEVVPYWRALIDANADRLAVPGNADLIYPGQVLVLPGLI